MLSFGGRNRLFRSDLGKEETESITLILRQGQGDYLTLSKWVVPRQPFSILPES